MQASAIAAAAVRISGAAVVAARMWVVVEADANSVVAAEEAAASAAVVDVGAVVAVAADQKPSHDMREITMTANIRFLQTATLFLAFCVGIAVAQAQEKFKSPDEAVAALVAAARADNSRDLMKVLGADGREILFSGDPVADKNTRSAFLIAFDLKHQIVKKGDSAADLVIGPNDWQLPIPLIQKAGAWQFDTATGRREVLARRIGRNELDAVQAALAYVDAQNDYASMNPQGSKVDTYAQRIISSPGKKDGLYWPAAANEPQSPLGETFALATIQGYRPGADATPYHGYYYKVLTGQGANAPGGAMSYLAKGNLIGGFGLVAYPAEYGNSGVMTFIVNHSGVVLQKDLGPNTARIASRMTAFDPDPTWRKVPDADLAVMQK
jgi:archaellum component FlaF (FlaF/FlaG flagellin family)